MGQACVVSERNEQRIHKLESLLSEQEAEKEALQQRLEEEKLRHRKLMSDPEISEEVSSQKIETLTKEKKHIFKQMLKEKKNVSKLQDSIQEYKDKIAKMEAEINKIIDEDTESEGVASDEDEQPQIEEKTTLMLDVNFDPQSEAARIYSWIHDQNVSPKNKAAVKLLKHRLASLLTARSESYRQQLVQAYFERYGINLDKDIKAAIGKGNSLAVISGLLVTRAEYDAMLISDFVANGDILPIADIICCRSMEQMKELHEAYKKNIKGSLKKQLQALAQKKKKATLVKVIGKMFDFNREVSKEVDMSKVNDDLNFMLTTKTFKGDNKERLILIFTTNNEAYIKMFHSQYKLKSKVSLTAFIDKKLGQKSTVGHFCKTRIEYALDTPDYYARKIKKLGAQFQKNKKKIADIFIQRLEIDLDLIKRQWEIKKYGDNNKTLAEWIETKTASSKYGNFLIKMLRNCDRYGSFREEEQSKFLKII